MLQSDFLKSTWIYPVDLVVRMLKKKKKGTCEHFLV